MMGMIETVTNKILQKYSNATTPKIKVCMMGPRQVGKTSILTAIFKNAGDAVIGSKIVLTADSATMLLLDERHIELQEMFHKNGVRERPGIGIAASDQEHVFNFNIRVNKTAIGLEIKDFPGEYLTDNPGSVNEFLKASDAVFIAIDTPHLMEENGRFNEAKNRTGDVISFFKNNYGEGMGHKLVMLVPLKCEKYFFEGKIDAVSGKVKDAYRELFEYLDTEHKSYTSCVIAPILTVGGVVFDGFEKDDAGSVSVLINGIPKKANYRFHGTAATYNPQFCDQPLYYLLSFIAKQYSANRIKKNLWGRFTSIFNLFSNDPSLLLEVKRLGNGRMENRNGYRIITGKHLV
jgi:hypothetical protein